MSPKYRELMRKHGEIEMKFHQIKAWKEDMLARAIRDQSLETEDDYQHATCIVRRDYNNMLKQCISERLEVEEQIRDELKAMHMMPIHQQVVGAFRPDGKVDFGKAFVFLSDQIRGLTEKIEEISGKTAETNRVLVDSE